MADVDHPKTHVEDQDIELPRKQPESPHREGIDPLTEGDTMYPREDVKGTAEKLAREESKAEPEQTAEEEVAEETVQAQEERTADPAGAREDQKRGGFFSRSR